MNVYAPAKGGPAWHLFVPKLYTVLRQGYDAAGFRRDLLAGLTVAIVALPLAMALAIASGTTPDKGLVTAVVAGFLISALGGSRFQIGGPTGAFVVVVYGVIAKHGYDGLVVATAMAGVLLVIAGFARLGTWIKYIPLPVVTGFTSGIAVIIASSQVADLLGLSIDKVPAEFIEKWAAYASHLGTANYAALAVATGALATILGLRALAPKLPGFLIAVGGASLAVWALGLDVQTIGSRFGDLPSTLPAPQVPAVTGWAYANAGDSAVSIAAIAKSLLDRARMGQLLRRKINSSSTACREQEATERDGERDPPKALLPARNTAENAVDAALARDAPLLGLGRFLLHLLQALRHRFVVDHRCDLLDRSLGCLGQASDLGELLLDRRYFCHFDYLQ